MSFDDVIQHWDTLGPGDKFMWETQEDAMEGGQAAPGGEISSLQSSFEQAYPEHSPSTLEDRVLAEIDRLKLDQPYASSPERLIEYQARRVWRNLSPVQKTQLWTDHRVEYPEWMALSQGERDTIIGSLRQGGGIKRKSRKYRKSRKSRKYRKSRKSRKSKKKSKRSSKKKTKKRNLK